MSYINLENQADTLGVSYITRDLLQDIDSNFGQSYNITDQTYTGTFTNSNLVSGILTVTHNLNTGFPKVMIRRPDGTYENAIAIMTYQSVNQVTFDFAGAIESGTWNIQIRK